MSHGGEEEVVFRDSGKVPERISAKYIEQAQRKYSVAEIDHMRRSCWVLFRHDDRTPIEEGLRTYMLNGTEPDELRTVADAILKRATDERAKDAEARRAKMAACSSHQWERGGNFARCTLCGLLKMDE